LRHGWQHVVVDMQWYEPEVKGYMNVRTYCPNGLSSGTFTGAGRFPLRKTRARSSALWQQAFQDWLSRYG
jgi:hypothetical protein